MLLVALTAEVLGIASGSSSIARGALPLAMTGMALVLGRPTIPVIVLAFALVPVPEFVQSMPSPAAESILAALAEQVAAGAGVALEVSGPLIQYHGGRFELLSYDNGIVTAVVLVQVGWYASLRVGSTPARSVIRAAGWGLLVVVVQPLLILVCVASLPLRIPDVGRFCLTHGPWLLAGLGVLLWPGAMRRSTR